MNLRWHNLVRPYKALLGSVAVAVAVAVAFAVAVAVAVADTFRYPCKPLKGLTG